MNYWLILEQSPGVSICEAIDIFFDIAETNNTSHDELLATSNCFVGQGHVILALLIGMEIMLHVIELCRGDAILDFDEDEIDQLMEVFFEIECLLCELDNEKREQALEALDILRSRHGEIFAIIEEDAGNA